MKINKTNALRLLDQKKISYEIKTYQYDEDHLSGEHIIGQVDLKGDAIYKTLVLHDKSEYLVCCIPVLEEIDLKKLAKATKHKSVAMIPQKDLLKITGYIRGGCSPIGMKKQYPTFIQKDIVNQTEVAFSAGKRGMQMIVAPNDIINVTGATLVDVIKKA